MRILVVTSQFPIAGEPTRGRPIHQTVRELAKLADVRVVSPVAVYPRWAQPRSYLYRAPEKLALDCDVEYVSYPALPAVSRPFNGWLSGRAIDGEVERFKPDVVLAYWLYPDAFGAMCAARRHGIPLVAGARGSDIRVRDAISRVLTQRVVRTADRLLVVSEDLGRLAVSEYGADPKRVSAIANGCDANVFHLGDRGAARDALGVAADAKLIVYAGRLVVEKGLRELIAASRQIATERPNVELALIGNGPLANELTQMAVAAAPLRVHLPGAIAPDAVARWMTAGDVFALPSYSEGYPNVLVEALACGRPIVATRVGGIPEIVDDSTGVLIAPRDEAELRRALVDVLDRDWDETLLSRRFSRDWAAVAAETRAVCESAVNDRVSRAKAAI
jgi:teichuronic acid biosynthesis glycosyltransferase TuaC